jgi:hypothetical protein
LFTQVDVPLLTGFTEKAGRQLTDVWIRREIHDFVTRLKRNKRLVERPNVLFLSCDLMSVLAAEAEGLRTCYFNSETPDKPYFDDLKQVADFVVTCSILFKRLRVNVYLSGDEIYQECLLEGVWKGKMPPDWYEDRFRMSLSAPSRK